MDIRVTTEESERSALGLGQSGANTRGFVLSPAVPMGLISRNMETGVFFFSGVNLLFLILLFNLVQLMSSMPLLKTFPSPFEFF